MNSWEREKNNSLKLTDSLGKKIDKNILDTVVALRLLGFTTASSCGGHKNWGLPGPWIDIVNPRFEEYIDGYNKPIWGLVENKTISEKEAFKKISKIQKGSKYKKLRMALTKDIENILNLIDDFNRKTELTPKERLYLELLGDTVIRVISYGTNIDDHYIGKARHKNLNSYRKVMRSFTKYLKEIIEVNKLL